MNYKIVIYGLGSISKVLSENIGDNTQIVAYMSDYEKGDIRGIPIIDINGLKELEYDYVVVSFGNSIAGIKRLVESGISKEKIVGYAYGTEYYGNNAFQSVLEKMQHEELQDMLIPQLFKIPCKKMNICYTNIVDSRFEITRDYVREQMLFYLAKEIHELDIAGIVMEAGVSRGCFSSKINEVFSDRKLFLFDTFEGLTDKDIKHAVDLGWGEKSYVLSEKYYSEETVLDMMPYRDKCVIKKGYFPDSFDIEEPIAFASLDVDFYESTLKGLKMIFSQLSKGGYIMVHDYNNIAFNECREAVRKFCYENDAKHVPIPDISGTVVITK